MLACQCANVTIAVVGINVANVIMW